MNSQLVKAYYKPKGITSAKFLNWLKKDPNIKKIGHGGTLDPLAEGVLVVGINEGTKQLQEILKDTEKEYVATIELGRSSNTFDLDGDIMDHDVKEFPKEIILKKGKVLQTPPKFSAIKINGKPAYKLARQGKEFNIPARETEIIDIELLEYSPPLVKIRLVVKSGFYVRSFVNDLGEELKTGAIMTGLIRTRVGDFKIEGALKV
jgi:tRNA pseudouridine55 synthase